MARIKSDVPGDILEFRNGPVYTGGPVLMAIVRILGILLMLLGAFMFSLTFLPHSSAPGVTFIGGGFAFCSGLWMGFYHRRVIIDGRAKTVEVWWGILFTWSYHEYPLSDFYCISPITEDPIADYSVTTFQHFYLLGSHKAILIDTLPDYALAEAKELVDTLTKCTKLPYGHSHIEGENQ